MSTTDSGAIPREFLLEAELLARGAEILPDGVEGLAAKLLQARVEARPLRVKLGVDPTSPHLHLGHTVVLRALKRFQDRGHQVVLLLGGFTAQIGDPTGRDTTRGVLSAEDVATNAATFLSQAGRIIDIAGVEVRNNSEWFDAMKLPELFRLVSLITVNQLVSKEGFANRMEAGRAVAVHELLYPALQGFDSVKIRADVEIGGTDQRFNLLMGRQLQPHFGQSPQVALMLPILVGTDGKRKMSKSFGNAIALDDVPDDVFGKCMRLSDELILTFFRLATNVSSEVIEGFGTFIAGGGNPMTVKLRLARQVVAELHGELAASGALDNWGRVHREGQAPEVMKEHALSTPVSLVALLVVTGMAASNGKARTLIEQGGVRLDGEKVQDVHFHVPCPPAAGTVLQVGARRFLKLVAG